MHKKRILKFFRNTVSVALALSMLISNIGTDLSTVHAQGATQAVEAESEAVVAEEAVNSAGDYGLADNIQDGVILHCFDWKYNDIKAELKNIAEAGFTSVQTSPAQRADGYGSVHEWYYLYQPQGFTISSNALGTKEELKALCDEAHKYGIKVIVDVIGNHTCGMEGHNGPIEDNVKRSEFFRWNNKSSSEMSSEDWKNRYLVTHCNVGMRDLVTENTELQDIVAGYLAELKSIGVDGIRWDTAKHIGLPSEDGSQFWPKMAAQGLYQYGEILEGPSDDTNTDESKRLMKEYTDYMSVTDNNYGSRLCSAFRDGTVPADSGVWTTKGISSNKLVYWAESHDTYANDEREGGWTKYIDQNKIDRAYAIAASRADATALYYSRPLQTAKTAIKAGEKGSTHFTATEVAEVNKFHNNAVGERDYYVAGSDAAAVCRESGAVIVKASGSGNVSVANGGGLTKPGTYKDRISGAEWTVTSSTISGSVGASGIAVIYEESSSKPSVSASMTDGSSFTTDTQAVTFTVSNATSATYSIDGGAATSFTNSVKLTLGENTAFGSNVTVKITATNAEGTTEKTFTYTKKEAGKLEKNTVYFTKPSGWSSAKIYAYIPGDSATKLTGAWPGTAMTDEGNGVYSYTFDASVSECKVIFTDGTNQTPKDEPGKDCGHDYVSGKAYTCENEVWTAVEISNPTTPPTNTPVPTVTEAPVGIKINSSLADNSSFSTETETIKITLENAEKGTYCVDDGPVKEFTNSADVVIGKGKIADSTVTVKVTAEGNGETATKTFTYTKEYVATYSNQVVPVNAGAAMEEVVEEVKVNAASNSSLASQYATNANGVGTKKTITVDKSIADWDSSMLIAQGAANDDPRVYRPNSMYEVGIDEYALYGAYDDNNLYLMWEMTNVQDVVAPNDDYPLTQGTMYLNMNIPFFIAIDTGRSDVIGNSGKTTTGGTIWDSGITIENGFNRLIAISTNGANGPYVYGGDASGLNPVEIYSKSGGGESGAAKSGIQFGYGMGIVSSTVNGINGAYGANNNRVVGDVCDDSAAWVDFNTKGHDSAAKDYHYEIAIPLSELGISASDVENDGVGVLVIATSGKSGMDCLPYDVSMNDQADLDDTAGSQENNSFEKSDADNITCTFARIGNGDIPTHRPTAPPVATSTPVPTAEPTDVQVEGIAVNFGADRSAPQYNSTALEIKAEVSGGTAPYNYEFFVDNVSVKNGAEDTYTWQNGSAGAHTIKVVVTDSTGKTATVAKEYDLEQNGNTPINTPTPISTVTPVPTGTVTTAPLPTTGGDIPSNIQLTKLLVSCITEDGRYKIGDTYIMRAECENALGTAQYMFTYILNGEEVIVKNYGPEAEARFVATEPGNYSFKVYVVDNSNDANPEFETGEIIIQNVPDLTITPTPTNSPVVTDGPVVTETPITTVVPTTPPVATQKPATPTNAAAPSKGGVVSVDKATYKVTGTGNSKTVEYVGYKGTETTVAIPSTIKFNGVSYKVTSIADKTFKGNTKVKAVKIPTNVTKIGKEAFSGCTSLTTVKSGTNVASIGDKAFYNCKKLSSITLSSKLTTIGKSAFYKCVKLKKITLNSKVNKIGSKAFYGCKNLKTITIKTKKLTSKTVGSSAFKGINAKAKIKVPSSKLKAYKKLLKSKGAGSKVSYKKL